MKRLYNAISEAICKGISKAIDGDDMFDTDETFINPVEDDVEDTSTYTNIDKTFFQLKGYIDAGWKFPKELNIDTMPMLKTEEFEKKADEETRKFFTDMLFGYDELSDHVKALNRKYNVLLGFLYCIDALSYSGSNRYVKYHKDVGIITWRMEDGKKKQNFIDSDCHIISTEWFDRCEPFIGRFGTVKRGRKWNFMDIDGNLLSDTWFMECNNHFRNGYALVRMVGKENLISEKDGSLISPKWYDSMNYVHDGIAVVSDQNVYNCIDTNGNLLSEKWFAEHPMISDGIIKVKRFDPQRDKNVVNYMTKKGRLLSKTWFDDGGECSEGMIAVKENGMWHYVDKKMKPINGEWYEHCHPFSEGFGRVGRNGRCNFIDSEGSYIGTQWYDNATYFKEGRCAVALNGKCNFIDTEGNCISDEWYSDLNGFFVHGMAWVRRGRWWHIIDRHGRQLDSEGYPCAGLIMDNGDIYGKTERGNNFRIHLDENK